MTKTNYQLYENDLPSDLDLGKIVAIDTETMGLETRRDRLCLVQLSSGNNVAHLVQFPSNSDYTAPNLKRLLSDSEVQKIFHFARFDIAALRYYLKTPIPNVYCTKIASRLSRTYTEFHGLKDICSELLGIHICKNQQSSNWGQKKLSDAQMKYAAEDVLHLHKLKEKLDSMLALENRTHIAKSCFEFLTTRVEMDIIGWMNLDIFKH